MLCGPFSAGSAIPEDRLRQFVEKHFDEPGTELRPVAVTEDAPEPAFFAALPPDYRKWALSIHKLWCGSRALQLDPPVERFRRPSRPARTLHRAQLRCGRALRWSDGAEPSHITVPSA